MVICKGCKKEFDFTKLTEVKKGLVKCPGCGEHVTNDGSICQLTKSEIPIIKRDDEKQIVYGVVYEPDVVDAHGDYTDAEEIEKACHEFLEEYQNISFMHQELINKDARISECYIAPVDFEWAGRKVKKGTWMMAVHVLNGQMWSLVKEGKITGFSMEGTASR